MKTTFLSILISHLFPKHKLWYALTQVGNICNFSNTPMISTFALLLLLFPPSRLLFSMKWGLISLCQSREMVWRLALVLHVMLYLSSITQYLISTEIRHYNLSLSLSSFFLLSLSISLFPRTPLSLLSFFPSSLSLLFKILRHREIK